MSDSAQQTVSEKYSFYIAFTWIW